MAVRNLSTILKEKQSESKAASDIALVPAAAAEQATATKFSSILGHIQFAMQSKQNVDAAQGEEPNEVTAYLALPNPALDSDPLLWCKEGARRQLSHPVCLVWRVNIVASPQAVHPPSVSSPS